MTVPDRVHSAVAHLARAGFTDAAGTQTALSSLGLADDEAVVAALAGSADPDLAVTALTRIAETADDRTALLAAVATDEGFREQMRAALGASGGLWQRFAPRLFYAAGNLKEPAAYDDLAKRLRLLESTGGERGRLFYLAVPPSVYETAIEGLSRSGAMPRSMRRMRTKPSLPTRKSLAASASPSSVAKAARLAGSNTERQFRAFSAGMR